MEEHISWLQLLNIRFFNEYPYVGLTALVVMTVIVISVVVRGRLAAKPDVVPSPKISLLNLAELYVSFIQKFCRDTVGPNGDRYISLAGTVFLVILLCNLLGSIPGFLPPTQDLNTTLAFGVFVFIYYNLIGIKEHGLGYIKHFIGPTSSKMFIPIIPLMFVIELVSHLVRPLSLALRLRGNIYGDHAVHGVFSSLVPYLVPIAFLALGIFVAFIQAFVFTLLTLVYVSLAEAHEH
jgi:F-type H+-transporting ATPase subunit a